jgi:hypothetical protein
MSESVCEQQKKKQGPRTRAGVGLWGFGFVGRPVGAPCSFSGSINGRLRARNAIKVLDIAVSYLQKEGAAPLFIEALRRIVRNVLPKNESTDAAKKVIGIEK